MKRKAAGNTGYNSNVVIGHQDWISRRGMVEMKIKSRPPSFCRWIEEVSKQQAWRQAITDGYTLFC
jgi:hypothetical protein